MKIEAISSVIVAVVAVVSLLLKLYDKHHRLFLGLIESIFEGIPFGFIPNHLLIAIILFTCTRLFEIFKEAKKPNPCFFDVFFAMGSFVLKTGIFAAVVVFVRSK